MRLFVTIGLWLCIVIPAQAQEIKVLESESRLPVPGVTIYNQTKTIMVITDFEGMASLNSFTDSEYLYFEDFLHKKLKIKKETIIANNHTVLLEPKIEGLDEIVISASKFEQNKRDIPQKDRKSVV